MAVEKAIAVVDSMISSLESQLGVPPSYVDPDDVWALYDLKKSKNVYKIACQTPGCNYRMTKPFEHRCPSCFSKVAANLKPAFELKPLPLPTSSTPAKAQESAPEKSKEKPQEKSQEKSQEKPQEKSQEKSQEKPKEKAQEKPKEATAVETAAEVATPQEFDQAFLQVSQIVEVNRHPDADTLYVCKLKISETETRALVSGIVAHYKAEELLNRHVVTILNLKAAKLRGVMSEAMLLAGTDPATQKVCLVAPPEGSQVGDRVFLKGSQASANPAKTLSSKIWQKIVPCLKARSGLAHFNATVMVTSKGDLGVPGCGDEGGIH